MSDARSQRLSQRRGRSILHTYSAYAGNRHADTAYHDLDLVPKGRDEGDAPQSWAVPRSIEDRGNTFRGVEIVGHRGEI